MKSRRHRVVLDLTFDRPVGPKDAEGFVSLGLTNHALPTRFGKATAVDIFNSVGEHWGMKITKARSAQFNRVLLAELRKRGIYTLTPKYGRTDR